MGPDASDPISEAWRKFLENPGDDMILEKLIAVLARAGLAIGRWEELEAFLTKFGVSEELIAELRRLLQIYDLYKDSPIGVGRKKLADAINAIKELLRRSPGLLKRVLDALARRNLLPRSIPGINYVRITLGGSALGTGIAVAVAAAAVGFAIWRIYSVSKQAYGVAPMPPSGPPCKGDPSMSSKTLGPVTGRSIAGGVSAWENAVKKAQKECDKRAGRCSGNCADKSKQCKPNVSVQDFTPNRGVLWASVDLTFRCPCECL